MGITRVGPRLTLKQQLSRNPGFGHNKRLLTMEVRTSAGNILRASEVVGKTQLEIDNLSSQVDSLRFSIPPVEVIVKIRSKIELTRKEMFSFIDGIVEGRVSKEQIGAWLMAVRLNGLTDNETTWLTEAMTKSGTVFNLSSVKGMTVDKHSTGGISDGTSLVIAPLVATFDLKVPMMSGRGLAHTGGTLDKLESIPGFNVNLTEKEVIKSLNEVGLAIFSQTPEVAPADKILYAVRDVTGTVDSIPLIVGSIISKKLAEGSQGLVMNVTTGTGAFMSCFEDAKVLAEKMVAAARGAGRKASSVISSMDQPLAPFVGNALEVQQAIRILRGETKGFERFIDVVIELSAHMLIHGDKYAKEQLTEARAELRKRLSEGKALANFRNIIKMQGGNEKVIDDFSLFPQAAKVVEVKADIPGYVQSIEATKIGMAACYLGAGRETADSKIDFAVGLEVQKFIGDKVEVGEPLAKLHINNEERLEMAKQTLLGAYQIGVGPVEKPKLILETIA